jgi:hypothetical protein
MTKKNIFIKTHGITLLIVWDAEKLFIFVCQGTLHRDLESYGDAPPEPHQSAPHL